MEILNDIDVECMEHAARRGIALVRIPSANATPTFISALADIICSRTAVNAPAELSFSVQVQPNTECEMMMLSGGVKWM